MLSTACYGGSGEVVRALVDAKADVNLLLLLPLLLLLLLLLLSLPPRLTITDSVERLPPRCMMPPIQNHAAAAAQKSVVIPAPSKNHQE